jgi:phosphoglycerate dehydrogenase-like enzyme
MKVLVPYRQEIADTIQSVLGDKAQVITSERTAEDMLEKGSDAVAVASGRVPSEYIKQAKSLKMIQAFGAGVDKIDHEAVLARGDLIVCNNHVNADEVAEYAIMLLLAVTKHIIPSHEKLREGDWSLGWGSDRPNIEIRKKQLLIVGLGNVGRAIAKRLQSFDVEITAVTRTGESDSEHLVHKLASVDQIEDIVRQADFVILSLPLTDESEGLVDEEFLSWMKPASILVNVSRGPIIKESALYHALQDNKIAGAALDVWWEYPKEWGGTGKLPSEEYAFHKMKNVVLSPHRAGYSEHIHEEQLRFVGENILRFIRGEEPKNQVDPERGY